MTPKQVENFAHKHIPKIMKMMGMPHIRPLIKIYDDKDDSRAGYNTSHEYYQRRPTIAINYALIDDESDLKDTILHECCHCIHAKAAYFLEAVLSMTNKQEHHHEIERCYHQMCEDIVESMMQMFDEGEPYKIQEFLNTQ